MNTIEKTFDENVDVLSEAILKAVEMAEPAEWHEWDSFAGRMNYRKQPLRDAQKNMVKRLLTDVFQDKRVDLSHKITLE